MTRRVIDCGGRPLDISRPAVMGILNITPDSFSDGGDFVARDDALARARAMVAEGADIIDIGGESTRPGAEDVPVDEELARVVPVVEALAGELPVPLSVDTTKPEVMRAVAGAGAGLINDVMALQRPGAVVAAADTGLPVCLMHMQGTPRNMQRDPHYDDIVDDVARFLRERVDACVAGGVPRERLILDPGFGFGKRHEHNAGLLRRLAELTGGDLPVLVGLSRKSFIGELVDRPPKERVAGSIAAAVLAAAAGARIIRVHDVAATVDALKVVNSVAAPDDGVPEAANG
ncbi:Dihydropteroate synthase [wastewater metagenome]|uniref:dihydropteroate synthase n=2 Tax=unclassified sequences TaxID=12908 RepID=A0A5B8R6I5_9ZZZZ|nr:dihydropteroate synthase [Arhodomonas aquaeolei]MCS4504682.1 dihydropteroate synthase [Arhodomonas aquaeolei]QEA04051.1 dihydropteroate synthase [uncultured organism]